MERKQTTSFWGVLSSIEKLFFTFFYPTVLRGVSRRRVGFAPVVTYSLPTAYRLFQRGTSDHIVNLNEDGKPRSKPVRDNSLPNAVGMEYAENPNKIRCFNRSRLIGKPKPAKPATPLWPPKPGHRTPVGRGGRLHRQFRVLGQGTLPSGAGLGCLNRLWRRQSLQG